MRNRSPAIQHAGTDPGWITAVVLFTHPEVSFEVDAPTVDVIAVEELLEYLSGREGRMSKRQIVELAVALEGRGDS